jgi:hypothetical protein
MRNAKPISVPMVAMTTAALYAVLAILFVPALSFLFLLTSSGAAGVNAPGSDTWMMIAVFSPLLCGVMGLTLGGFMASMFNLFVGQRVRPRPAKEAMQPVHAASIGDAA